LKPEVQALLTGHRWISPSGGAWRGRADVRAPRRGYRWRIPP